MLITNTFITDFTDPAFQNAFKRYFGELGIKVNDWDGLWREMNGSDNKAYLRMVDGQTAGFIQFTEISLDSWFFKEKCGFIREFWIDKRLRRRGHGSALLAMAEKYFLNEGMSEIWLTTDTAPEFYLRMGYVRRPDITAKNNDEVFSKSFSQNTV